MRVGHGPLARRLYRSQPDIYDPTQVYPAGRIVSSGGKIWITAATAPRGVYPAGLGDGSTADRNLLLSQMGGYASEAGVTGGAAGTTYVVTSKTNSGPGSLREALESSNPYWIIFDKTVFPPGVETTVNLTTRLIPMPNKTVDGRGSKVFVSNSYDNVIEGIGNPFPGSSAFIRYPNGVANMIFSHIRWDVTTTNLDRDCFTIIFGTDGIWFNFCWFTGGTDGTIDIAAPDGVGQGSSQHLYGFPNSIKTRIHFSWCGFGPMPTNANLAMQGALTGGNNLPENGKTNLWGLINDTPDKLFVSCDHCWWDGSVERNPKLWYGAHGHIYNSMVSRWMMVPGLVADSTYIAAYEALGKSAKLAHYGTVGTEISLAAKVLLENTIYKPYRVGDPHVLDPTWPILYPDLRAVYRPTSDSTSALRTSGLSLMNGASAAVDKNAGLVEARPYSYTLTPADSDLDSDLQTGVGNYQPWIPA